MFFSNEQISNKQGISLPRVDNFWLFVEFLYEWGGRACLF